MKQVRLGRSNMTVSKIGLGGIPIQRLSEDDAVNVVRHAFKSGINWVDTANGYGSSEERIGKALQTVDRESVKIFSKAGAQEPEQFEEQVKESFRRLNTDFIDLYQFHIVPDADVWQKMQDNGTFDVLRRYRDQGKIRHIGASAHTLEAVFAILEHPEIEVVQWPFNFIVIDDGLKVLDVAVKNDIGFIAMKPFCGGVVDDAEVCIGFQLQYPAGVTDPGFETIEEIDEVVAIANKSLPLTGKIKKKIDSLQKEMGTRFCRRCGYCSPCPHGVSIIPLMTMDSLIKRFSRESVINGWIGKAAETIEKCTECGLCEKKCPYKLSIRSQIKEGAACFAELTCD